jgi:hypothetical protein
MFQFLLGARESYPSRTGYHPLSIYAISSDVFFLLNFVAFFFSCSKPVQLNINKKITNTQEEADLLYAKKDDGH